MHSLGAEPASIKATVSLGIINPHTRSRSLFLSVLSDLDRAGNSPLASKMNTGFPSGASVSSGDATAVHGWTGA